MTPQAAGASAAAPSPPSSAGSAYPAVVYSKIDESAHQPDEYCFLDNLIADAKVFAWVVMGCSTDPVP